MERGRGRGGRGRGGGGQQSPGRGPPQPGRRGRGGPSEGPQRGGGRGLGAQGGRHGVRSPPGRGGQQQLLQRPQRQMQQQQQQQQQQQMMQQQQMRPMQQQPPLMQQHRQQQQPMPMMQRQQVPGGMQMPMQMMQQPLQHHQMAPAGSFGGAPGPSQQQEFGPPGPMPGPGPGMAAGGMCPQGPPLQPNNMQLMAGAPRPGGDLQQQQQLGAMPPGALMSPQLMPQMHQVQPHLPAAQHQHQPPQLRPPLLVAAAPRPVAMAPMMAVQPAAAGQLAQLPQQQMAPPPSHLLQQQQQHQQQPGVHLMGPAAQGGFVPGQQQAYPQQHTAGAQQQLMAPAAAGLGPGPSAAPFQQQQQQPHGLQQQQLLQPPVMQPSQPAHLQQPLSLPQQHQAHLQQGPPAMQMGPASAGTTTVFDFRGPPSAGASSSMAAQQDMHRPGLLVGMQGPQQDMHRPGLLVGMQGPQQQQQQQQLAGNMPVASQQHQQQQQPPPPPPAPQQQGQQQHMPLGGGQPRPMARTPGGMGRGHSDVQQQQPPALGKRAWGAGPGAAASAAGGPPGTRQRTGQNGVVMSPANGPLPGGMGGRSSGGGDGRPLSQPQQQQQQPHGPPPPPLQPQASFVGQGPMPQLRVQGGMPGGAPMQQPQPALGAGMQGMGLQQQQYGQQQQLQQQYSQQQQGAPGTFAMPQQPQQPHPDLTARLSAAATPAAVLAVAAERGSGLFTEHLVLCLHRLGQMVQAGQAFVTSEPPVQQQLQGLLAECSRRLGSMAPRQLAEALWGLVQLQLVPDVATLDAWAGQCLAKLQGFSIEQLTSSLWSLATLRYVPATPLLEAAAAALHANVAHCAPQHAAQAMWAFACMEYRPPTELLDAVLKLLADALPSFSAVQLSQLMWAYAMFGHQPLPSLMASVMAQAERAGLAALQPDGLTKLLTSLRALGCVLPTSLLTAAGSVAAANISSFTVDDVIALMQVSAGARHHPGPDLLHRAAQHVTSKLQQAAAGLPATSIAALLESYAVLAYAPPKALLHLLRTQLIQQLPAASLDPSQLAGVLWCLALFSDLTPELWNPATELLAPAASALQPAVLTQLYQAYMRVTKLPAGAAAQFVTPPPLIHAAWQAYRAAQEALLASTSEMAQDVGRVLSLLGLPAVRAVTDDGLFALQLALPARGIAVEVVGPESFCVNQQQPLGEAVMRNQLLSACGWQLVTVPHYEWVRGADDSQKVAYLRRQLGLSS